MTEPIASPVFSPQPEPSPARRQLLFLLLLLTFVRGLLYLAVMPPWQHYDEPTHFEYVRLLAERRQLPQPGDYDLGMRREIVASMLATGFWQVPPEIDFESDKPPFIGVPELNHPPFYYALLAAPQLLVQHQDIETQLYLGRFVSVLLYVLIVGSAYGLIREGFPRRRWLPIAVATFIALLPPFTDLMSAVSNDVGAVAAVSLLLWASVRLIRRGFSLKLAIAVLLLTGICLFTKTTASITAVAVLLAVGVSLVPASTRRWLWIGMALSVPIGLIAALTWGGHAAQWYDPYAMPSAENRAEVESPLGRAAFALSTNGEPYPNSVYQELLWLDGESMVGRTLTLGAWVKADTKSGESVSVALKDKAALHAQAMPATTDWQFHAFTATAAAETPGLVVQVSLPSSDGATQTVFVDGIVLVDGEMPLDEAPRFDTAQGAAGMWGGHTFTNLVQNGSAEKVWPGLRGWLGDRRMYQKPLSLLFHSLMDWSHTGWVYVPELSVLLESFWARFSWNQISLPQTYSHVLGLLALASLVGCVIGLVRTYRSDSKVELWQRHVWLLLALVWLLAWGATLVRIHPVSAMVYRIYWPVARYAAVAIVPTAAFLCIGLAMLVPRRWHGWAAIAGLLGMVTLDTVALLNAILPYYYF